MTRLFFKIDSVNDEDPVLRLKYGEQVETHRPAINELDLRREGVLLFDGIDCMDPDAFIGEQNIAEA